MRRRLLNDKTLLYAIAGFIAIVLVLLLASCEGEGPLIVTATPPSNTALPTDWPTQEVWTAVPFPTNTPQPYTGHCLPSGVVPIHTGACPEQPQDEDIELVSIENGNWEFAPAIAFSDDSYFIDLPNGAGFAGVRIHGLELESGRCYGVNMTGHSDLRDLPYYQALGNFAAVARVHKSNGEVVILPQHTMRVTVDGKSDLTGPRDFFWGLYSNDANPTIVLEVGVNAVWATALPGNHFRIDALFVQRMADNGHCAGIPGV
jgi:hypothetical protein